MGVPLLEFIFSGEEFGGILLSEDYFLSGEQLSVRNRADLIDNGRLNIEAHENGDDLVGTSFREEGVESTFAITYGLFCEHLNFRLNEMLESEVHPKCVTFLYSS